MTYCALGFDSQATGGVCNYRHYLKFSDIKDIISYFIYIWNTRIELLQHQAIKPSTINLCVFIFSTDGHQSV